MTANKLRLVTISIVISLSASLQTMDCDPLSTIEQQLVLREIQKQGLETILQKIQSTPAPQAVTEGFYCRIIVPTALKIEGVFHINETTFSPLAKNIFDKIKTIEQKSGYRPESTKNTFSGNCHIQHETNYLGTNTRYYWIQETESVRVIADLCNTKTLLEFINKYRD